MTTSKASEASEASEPLAYHLRGNPLRQIAFSNLAYPPGEPPGHHLRGNPLTAKKLQNIKKNRLN